MKYDIARKSMSPGDIVAFKHSDIMSKIIILSTGYDCSHVGLVWRAGERVFVIEAVMPMIRIYPLSKLLPFRWIAMDKPMSADGEEYALSRVGEKYSVSEAVRGDFGMASNNNRWQCAEFVRAVLNHSGWKFDNRDTPGDLVVAAIDAGGIINLVQ